MIIKYALTYENGLQVLISPNGNTSAFTGLLAWSAEDIPSIVNPLRLICKQLHTETHGVVFEANSSVEIICMRSAAPLSTAYDFFLNNIPPAAKTNLRHVTITGDPSIKGRGMATFPDLHAYVAGFKPLCERYTDIVVKI
ncbi:hypothetical protein NX059_004719 [Plenodomus lindquistii]|nr:hypothetical protein NX059_004719 [Plenodomus lindquistii]